MDVFIAIKDVPVHCNLLWPSREAALNAPRGDIRLAFCEACGMIYNLAFDPSRMQYTQAYENSLHFSPRFQTYAEEMAAYLIEQYRLQSKTIIEIGCGNGEFLSRLCQGGQNRGIGFDPSYNDDGHSARSDAAITFIRDVYSPAYAAYEGDLICCRQVLEHIQDPRDFLLRVRQAIGNRQDTRVFFEVPNVLYTLRDLGIWDIIYEHCSYFSAPSLARLFRLAGFTPLRLYEAFEGQFLCLEAAPSPDAQQGLNTALESLGELTRLVADFAAAYCQKVERWQSQLSQLVQSGRRAVVWGAGSKGTTFLNIHKALNAIEYVVDVNPRKQQMFVAGTGQRIVPPSFLQGYHPDILLVMNPVYADEIAQLADSLGVKTELVTV